jgi:hypothetical protein
MRPSSETVLQSTGRWALFWRHLFFIAAIVPALVRAGTLNNPYPNGNYGVEGTSPSISYATNSLGLPDRRTGTISYSRTFSARNSEGIYNGTVILRRDGVQITAAPDPIFQQK